MEDKGSRELLEKIVRLYDSETYYGETVDAILCAKAYLNNTFVVKPPEKMLIEIEIDAEMKDCELHFRADGKITGKIINIQL